MLFCRKNFIKFHLILSDKVILTKLPTLKPFFWEKSETTRRSKELLRLYQHWRGLIPTGEKYSSYLRQPKKVQGVLVWSCCSVQILKNIGIEANRKKKRSSQHIFVNWALFFHPYISNYWPTFLSLSSRIFSTKKVLIHGNILKTLITEQDFCQKIHPFFWHCKIQSCGEMPKESIQECWQKP